MTRRTHLSPPPTSPASAGRGPGARSVCQIAPRQQYMVIIHGDVVIYADRLTDKSTTSYIGEPTGVLRRHYLSRRTAPREMGGETHTIQSGRFVRGLLQVTTPHLTFLLMSELAGFLNQNCLLSGVGEAVGKTLL